MTNVFKIYITCRLELNVTRNAVNSQTVNHIALLKDRSLETS